MPKVEIEADDLRTLVSAADAYSEDLSTGLEEGIYEEGEDTLDELDAAIDRARGLLP